jgi:hypothetical protein
MLAAYGIEFLLSKDSKDKKELLKNISKACFTVGIIAVIVGIIVAAFKKGILSLGEIVLNRLYHEVYAGTIFVQNNSFESLLQKAVLVYYDILFSVIVFGLLTLSCCVLFNITSKVKKYQVLVKWLLLAVLIIDVMIFGIQFTRASDPENLFGATPETAMLNMDDDLFRIFPLDQELMPEYLAVRHGIQNALGYGSSRTQEYDSYLEDVLSVVDEAHSKTKWGLLTIKPGLVEKQYSAKLLGLLNVKYIFSKEKINNQDFTLYSQQDDKEYIYKNKLALPRAFVVGNYVVITDQKKAAEFMKSLDFSPIETVVLTEEPESPSSSKAIPATITEYKANRITVEAFLDEPGILVLSENYYPSWKAYENGKEIKVYKADYTLRAVMLGSGPHTITFSFDDSPFRTGKLVSLISIAAAILMLIISYKKDKIKKNLKKP